MSYFHLTPRFWIRRPRNYFTHWTFYSITLDTLCSLQIAVAEEASAATGEAASEAAVGSVAETAAATVVVEDTAAAATKWEEGQYLCVQRC